MANPFSIMVRVVDGDCRHTALIVVECTMHCVVKPEQIVGFLK